MIPPRITKPKISIIIRYKVSAKVSLPKDTRVNQNYIFTKTKKKNHFPSDNEAAMRLKIS